MRPDLRWPLVQREQELDNVRRSIADVERGGAILVVEGPAGIGKSRLLSETRACARAAGRRVLSARATELERDFSFGIVRQLFESLLLGLPARERRRVLSGPAGGAAAIFPALGADAAGTAASFARLHGLYWLTANLVADTPTVVVIDDLHWADAASLRWLLYLLPRLEELPLLIVVGQRPDEPGADVAALAAVAEDPLATALRPTTLATSAVAEMLETLLGRAPHVDFADACRTVTGGNPLLLHELCAAVAADGMEPEPAAIPQLLHLGGKALVRLVGSRLARLPEEARRLAEACAVLGDGVHVSLAAELARLPAAGAGDALARLEGAGILRVEDGIEFAHPVIHEAVLATLAHAERERGHQRAAQLLHARGAEPEQVSAHLLACAFSGAEWEQAVLEEAARNAEVRGAGESAVAYLRRALACAPPEGRVRVLLRLGAAESGVDGRSAAEHLREAHALLADPLARAECAAQLARVLLFTGRTDEVATLLRPEIDALGSGLPELRRRLEALLGNGALFEPSLQAVADDALHDSFGDGIEDLGARMKRALATCRAAWAGRLDAAAALAHARDALSGDALLVRDNGGGPLVTAGWVIEAADELDEALALWESCLAEAQRRGSAFAYAAAKVFRAGTLLARGSPTTAEADAREAIEAFGVWGIELRSYPQAVLARARLECGDIDGAAAAAGAADLAADGHALRLLDARAYVHAARGEHARALRDFLLVGERFATLGGRNPAFFPWRSAAAEAALQLGDRVRARELAGEELELARRWGAPRALGRALRVAGVVAGRDGFALLEESAAVLHGSPARLEEGRALVELGAALRRANRRAAARDPLRRGLELAFLAGAGPLVERASTELRATGARPRRLVLSGLDALTASELRVATLAAEGGTNRDVAQALFVTPKTVELHLSSVYRKLDIDSRADLARALGRPRRAPAREGAAPAASA